MIYKQDGLVYDLDFSGISETTLEKWSEYELHDKLEQVAACCDAMKSRS